MTDPIEPTNPAEPSNPPGTPAPAEPTAPAADAATVPQRSWAPETDVPDAALPPSWDEPEALQEAAEEPELEAWLEAQETGWTEPQAEPEPAVEPDLSDSRPVTEGAAGSAEPSWQPSEQLPQATEPEPERDPEPAPAQPSWEPSEQVSPAVAEPQPEAARPEVESMPEVARPVVEAAEPTPALAVAHTAPEAEPEPAADAAELAATALFTPLPAEAAPVEHTWPDAEHGELAPALEVDEPAVPATRSGALAVSLLVALVVVLGGLSGYLGARSVSTRGGGGTEDARHDGLQAARGAARLVFSYDYRHLDKDFAAGKAVTTGAFAEQYGSTTPKLVDVAKRFQAVVVADVSDAAVISASTSKVTVLVFVNQQSTSTLSAAPKITQSRLTMTLLHRGGRWLVGEVHAF